MSCHVTKPSDAALQTALQAIRQAAYPPPLVPHPPEKTMAWRTRRIVAELNALKSVEALAGFEAELRGVLNAQESRCRTKVMTSAFSEECAVRERESLLSEEAAQRSTLARMYYTVTSQPFSFVHLRMQEEMTRRALRRSERADRRSIALETRAAQLFMYETRSREALCAQEGCCREELQFRRVVEIGNDLQREILMQSRLSGHLRSVAHSRTVQATRRQLELQEDRDRSAVARLYELHTIMLFDSAKADFTATIRKDVVLLSDANRNSTQHANEEACADRLRHCEEQETQLRLLVEAQEAAQLKTLARSFLLGWRAVYKAITKDPDVFSVFGKIELLVRREIADQERRGFGALQLASERGISVCQYHRTMRRSLCQDYVSGARAIWDEEGRAANALFRLHHLQASELNALRAATVLSAAESASRRGVCGAEAQARLGLKMTYMTSTVLLRCAEGTRRICHDEARCFDQLRRRCAEHFRAQHLERLAAEESRARMTLERDESAAAANTLISLRQALLHHRLSDATRPLLRVEGSFRSQVEREEAGEWRWMALQWCRFSALAGRKQIEADERVTREGVCVAQLCEAEDGTRHALCSAAVEQLATLHGQLQSTVEEEGTGNKDDEGTRHRGAHGPGDIYTEASLPVGGDWVLPECVEAPWPRVCAEWELYDDDDASTISLESPKISAVPAPGTYAVQCEELLADAYLERDRMHFTEHAEWRRLLAHAPLAPQEADSTDASPTWKLHSITLKQEPNQRAASVNMWDSNQLFDVSFPLAQQQEEGIVGERTIAFFVPYATSVAAVLPRDTSSGMVFFLILDEEGTVFASATLIMEADSESSACLCVALNNSAGYLRFEKLYEPAAE